MRKLEVFWNSAFTEMKYLLFLLKKIDIRKNTREILKKFTKDVTKKVVLYFLFFSLYVVISASWSEGEVEMYCSALHFMKQGLLLWRKEKRENKIPPFCVIFCKLFRYFSSVFFFNILCLSREVSISVWWKQSFRKLLGFSN